MNQEKVQRLADFQSIAVEEMEKGDTEVAIEFAEDVLNELQKELD